MKWIEPRLNDKWNGIDSLKYYIHHEIPADWDHMGNFYRQMSRGMLISINRGPYEVLKSRGMEKINNEDLRFWLIDVFESVIPRQLIFIESAEDRNQSRIDDIKAEMMENYTWISNSGNYIIGLRPRTKDILGIDKDLWLKTIQSESYIASEKRKRTQILKEVIHNTLLRIRSYLNELGVDPDSNIGGDNLGVRGMLSDSLNIRNR